MRPPNIVTCLLALVATLVIGAAPAVAQATCDGVEKTTLAFSCEAPWLPADAVRKGGKVTLDVVCPRKEEDERPVVAHECRKLPAAKPVKATVMVACEVGTAREGEAVPVELEPGEDTTSAAVKRIVARDCSKPKTKAEPVKAEPPKADPPKPPVAPAKASCDRECLEEVVKMSCGKNHGIDTTNWRGTREELMKLARLACHKHVYYKKPRAAAVPKGCADKPTCPAPAPPVAGDRCSLKGGIDKIPAGWRLMVWCRWTRAGATLVWGSSESRDQIRHTLYKRGALDSTCRPVVFVFKNTVGDASAIYVDGQPVAVRRNVPVTMQVCGRTSFGVDAAWIGSEGYIYIPATSNPSLCYPGAAASTYFTRPGRLNAPSELGNQFERGVTATRMNIQICGASS